jgi:hypothetical protein
MADKLISTARLQTFYNSIRTQFVRVTEFNGYGAGCKVTFANGREITSAACTLSDIQADNTTYINSPFGDGNEIFGVESTTSNTDSTTTSFSQQAIRFKQKGLYLITANIAFSAGSTGMKTVRIYAATKANSKFSDATCIGTGSVYVENGKGASIVVTGVIMGEEDQVVYIRTADDLTGSAIVNSDTYPSYIRVDCLGFMGTEKNAMEENDFSVASSDDISEILKS